MLEHPAFPISGDDGAAGGVWFRDLREINK